jgi:hypothetical protein
MARCPACGRSGRLQPSLFITLPQPNE